MLVRCTKTHMDVTAGFTYEVLEVFENGVDIVADDKGDEWFLANDEFEVVEDEKYYMVYVAKGFDGSAPYVSNLIHSKETAVEYATFLKEHRQKEARVLVIERIVNE